MDAMANADILSWLAGYLDGRDSGSAACSSYEGNYVQGTGFVGGLEVKGSRPGILWCQSRETILGERLH